MDDPKSKFKSTTITIAILLLNRYKKNFGEIEEPSAFYTEVHKRQEIEKQMRSLLDKVKNYYTEAGRPR